VNYHNVGVGDGKVPQCGDEAKNRKSGLVSKWVTNGGRWWQGRKNARRMGFGNAENIVIQTMKKSRRVIFFYCEIRNVRKCKKVL